MLLEDIEPAISKVNQGDRTAFHSSKGAQGGDG